VGFRLDHGASAPGRAVWRREDVSMTLTGLPLISVCTQAGRGPLR
jgi:hypothetical protein